jgi:O-antigen/teichoic acid export membrane protein
VTATDRPKEAGGVWARLGKAFEVTPAAGFGLAAAAWSFVSGPVTSLLILSIFTARLQGYYYTFQAVLGMTILAELGLSNVLRAFAAHEYVALSLDGRHGFVGDATALSRLVSMVRSAVRWYSWVGVGVGVGLSLSGLLFFRVETGGEVIAWARPWTLLCVFTALNTMLSPVWSVLEGCGQVTNVYLFRLGGALLGSAAIWVSIVLGAELWTGAISMAALVLWSLVFLVWKYRGFLRAFVRPPSGEVIDWRSEIWPIQRRAALAYLAGFLASYLFTPILFRVKGPVVAGQFGMSWALTASLASVAALWTNPRAPEFASLIARRHFKQAEALLRRIRGIVAGILVLGGAVGVAIVAALNHLQHPFAKRLIAPLPMSLLVLGAVAAGLLNPVAVYLRAYKKEPFALMSIAVGVLTAALTLLLASRYGVLGVCASYAVAQGVGLAWGERVSLARRREWQGVAFEHSMK